MLSSSKEMCHLKYSQNDIRCLAVLVVDVVFETLKISDFAGF